MKCLNFFHLITVSIHGKMSIGRIDWMKTAASLCRASEIWLANFDCQILIGAVVATDIVISQ